jgi:hypothetical protein
VAITEQLVRLADLAEAEGRLAKRAVFKLAVALGLLIVVVLMLTTAIALLIAAAYVALRRAMPIDGALLTLGLCILILAGLTFGWAKALSGDGDD